MYLLNELAPVLLGLALGWFLKDIASDRLRSLIFVCAAPAIGFLISVLAGELQISWGFVALDTLIITIAAVVGGWLRLKIGSKTSFSHKQLGI